ncbi:MAG: hypothetical protein GY839_03700 [candidate division Zixibacteria bacterium]|nr:hypothetical protein [candidate division Zixibacteria bacterium]
MRLVISLTLIALSILILTCSKEKATEDDGIILIEDLLVENNEITGWTYYGTNWVANNITELTTYINGAADLYQRHGFEEAAHQAYEGSIDDATRFLSVTVYNMGSESHAGDTYDDPETGLGGATDWTDGAGQRAHYIRYGGLSQILAFHSDAYFVYLEINYDSDESLNILKQFALNIDGKIQ